MLTTPLPPEAAAEALPRYHWQLADARDARGKRVDTLFVRRDAPVQLDFVDGRLAIGNLSTAWPPATGPRPPR
jgi:hypothetical protein